MVAGAGKFQALYSARHTPTTTNRQGTKNMNMRRSLERSEESPACFKLSWNEFFYPNRIDLFFNNLINGYLRILCGLRALSNWPKFIPVD